jgi:dephospho-CoA kinase
MILGVTGGLGCGKSTAATCFADRGFLRLDSDALVRERVLPAPEITAALRARHGPALFDAAGSVDRVALAQLVFSDDAERAWLEALTHPPVFELWRTALRAQPHARWVIEVPLLFEQALENWFDFTICVACDLPSQLARLEQRGLTRALAGQRISKQLPLARKVELSDFVLWNEGSAPFLQAQVDRIADSLA